MTRRNIIKIGIGVFAIGLGYYSYNLLSTSRRKSIISNRNVTSTQNQSQNNDVSSIPAYYQIYIDNNIAKALNIKKNTIDFQGPDHQLVIQNSLNNLPSRNDKLKVSLAGDFTLGSTLMIPSYTILEIKDSIRTEGINYDLIGIDNQSNIDILGGELIGPGPEQGTTGWGIRSFGNGRLNNNILVSGVFAHDFRMSGIALNKADFGCIVENCECDNNGLNGIGFGDISNFIANNNTCKGNLDTGINIEDGWDFNFADNTCTENKRHNMQLEHGVNGSITRGEYTNSADGDGISIRNRSGKGLESEKSSNVKVVDVFISSNALSGLIIYSSEKITVNRGTFKDNGQKGSGDGIRIEDDNTNLSINNVIQYAVCTDDQINKTQEYGIQELNGNYNTITNNDVRNNIRIGVKSIGLNSIVKDNTI